MGSAWLSEESGSADDPRAEALASLIAQGMPAKACAQAVQEALYASRIARIRWDSTMQAFQNQAQEATKRESFLKGKVLEVEEDIRKEQKASVEVRRKCTEQERTLRELESTISELRRPPAEAPREVGAVNRNQQSRNGTLTLSGSPFQEEFTMLCGWQRIPRLQFANDCKLS